MAAGSIGAVWYNSDHQSIKIRTPAGTVSIGELVCPAGMTKVNSDLANGQREFCIDNDSTAAADLFDYGGTASTTVAMTACENAGKYIER